MVDDIIVAEGLVKRFGKLTAVDHVDVRIRNGEIFGFLGPNGAGKTTTVRLLTTMDLPDEGRIFINGLDTSTQFVDARRHIGIIQQQHSLDKDISVRENIIHHALMQGLSLKEGRKRMMELAETMELTDRLDTLVSSLSGGWKKRVSIVCSMIHHPDILFMDEPTTGLDTQSRNLLWKLIRNLNHSGTTIFLTTHYIYEAENLCDRISIIDDGKIIAEGTPKELIEELGNVTLVRTDSDEPQFSYFRTREEAKEAAKDVGGEFSVMIRKTTLEDVFLELTGRTV